VARSAHLEIRPFSSSIFLQELSRRSVPPSQTSSLLAKRTHLGAVIEFPSHLILSHEEEGEKNAEIALEAAGFDHWKRFKLIAFGEGRTDMPKGATSDAL